MDYLFKWTDDMSVNQTIIDFQHRQLFNQINILLSAIVNRLEPKVVDEAITFLGQYIDGHLKYEEEYMKENNYPELALHQAEHQDFIKNYKKFRGQKNDQVSIEILAQEIEQYLGNWLINHIGQTDKKYAEYIEKMVA